MATAKTAPAETPTEAPIETPAEAPIETPAEAPKYKYKVTFLSGAALIMPNGRAHSGVKVGDVIESHTLISPTHQEALGLQRVYE